MITFLLKGLVGCSCCKYLIFLIFSLKLLSFAIATDGDSTAVSKYKMVAKGPNTIIPNLIERCRKFSIRNLELVSAIVYGFKVFNVAPPPQHSCLIAIVTYKNKQSILKHFFLCIIHCSVSM